MAGNVCSLNQLPTSIITITYIAISKQSSKGVNSHTVTNINSVIIISTQLHTYIVITF